jgi:hypothetical protein
MDGYAKWIWRFGGSLTVGMALALFGYLSAEEGGGAGSKYIGAAKCRNCHRAEKAGNQFAKWKKMEHAKAFETLGENEAKEIAKKQGVDDPQKSEKCLKCHATAFGEPAERLAKKFDPKAGVQCECSPTEVFTATSPTSKPC